MKAHRLSKLTGAVVLALGLSTSAMAADTTSAGIRGTVSIESGQTISNAVVILTDTRTGAIKTLTTNDSGNFSSKGLRVGGPYTVMVKDDQGSRTIEDVYLNLGSPTNLAVELVSVSSVERIVVTGTVSGLMMEANGPSANFSFEDLQAQPTISRDIKDVLANDPRIVIDSSNSDAIQCAGTNNRFNSVTVDGIKQNDNFGLNNNGYPTERLPFPFDAIDQVAVELAPFDVEFGGFTGCNVNAVIRSGTNEFHGSVFMDYTNDSMQGDEIDGDKFDVPSFSEKRMGFTLGGPIVKDKLFFFAAYEKHNPSKIFDDGPEGAGFAEPIEGLTVSTLDEVAQIAKDVYGYQVGDIINSADEKEEKVLLKLDWYINEDHRTSLTYQNTDGNTISSTGTGSDSYAFNDRYYERANELTTYSAQIFSDWTDDFVTEIRIGRAELKNGQTPFTSDASFGDFKIEEVVPNVDLFLGADQFRQANILEYTTDSLKLSGTYYMGDHEFTGGFEYESVDVFNLFVPGSQGIFEFASLDDFRNGKAKKIEYKIPTSLNANDGAAAFTFETTTLYLQDRIVLTDDLTVTLGLRYDKWDSDDSPTANNNYKERYGTTNAVGPDMDLLQPRLGFNYIIDDETFVYGGVGLFAGGNPNVWLSNNYSNNGVAISASKLEVGKGANDTENAAIDAALLASNTNNFGFELPALSVDQLVGGDGAVNAMSDDFKVPALWKYNLGIQREFENNLILGADVIYSKQQDSAKTIALNTVKIGTAPDGRPIYKDVDLLNATCKTSPISSDCRGRSTVDYLLTNSDKDGTATIISLFANQSFDNGFKYSAGYAFMDAAEGSPMNSSTVSSNFGNLSVKDLNDPAIATSNYEVRHRFTLNLSYSTELIDGYASKVSMFAQRVKGKAFSWTFDGDPGFGDVRFYEDRNLLYVPLENDPNVTYGSDFQLEEFNQFIADNDLEGSRGSILDRNTANSSWWTRVDIKFTQEIPGFMDDHKGSIFLSIKNVGNLLNDKWGKYQQVDFEYNAPVVDANINNGQYEYTNFDGFKGQSVNSTASSWSAVVGIKYDF
ncbi:TonB-dependent receptor [Colwellia sp. UCD-KL20]|uniref:TonB-dependent receptor n=1 Tax=Colwellia sp. UCD-KL20 TaxID=1917165 RepID=UPI0015C2F505|nr:TonB-dependent receptor [Colwellia sp. UCD-KL20]